MVLGDCEAGVGDAGGIGKREVVLVGDGLGRLDGDLSSGFRLVIGECRLAQVDVLHGVLVLAYGAGGVFPRGCRSRTSRRQ